MANVDYLTVWVEAPAMNLDAVPLWTILVNWHAILPGDLIAT